MADGSAPWMGPQLGGAPLANRDAVAGLPPGGGIGAIIPVWDFEMIPGQGALSWVVHPGVLLGLAAVSGVARDWKALSIFAVASVLAATATVQVVQAGNAGDGGRDVDLVRAGASGRLGLLVGGLTGAGIVHLGGHIGRASNAPTSSIPAPLAEAAKAVGA